MCEYINCFNDSEFLINGDLELCDEHTQDFLVNNPDSTVESIEEHGTYNAPIDIENLIPLTIFR